MKRLILSLLLLSSTAHANEIISGLDEEKDTPVINEEFRKTEREILNIKNGPTVSHGWAMVDGADGSPAITVGYNASSVQDVGVGNYRIVWTRPYPTADYFVLTTGATSNTAQIVSQVQTKFSTSTTVYVTNTLGAATDSVVYVATFGSY